MNPLNRTYIINKIISDNQLNSYLEIGVSNPYANFLNIRCGKKVSVDPCIECEYFSARTIAEFKPFIACQMTSDEFFAQNREAFDIVFIDGDHSHKQSLADLNNALKIVPAGGFIVLHDACPISEPATRTDNFKKRLPYNGEVWKTALCAVRQSAGRLQIGTFPFDFGVCVIKKLAGEVPEIISEDLDYSRDYGIAALNPVYDFAMFREPRVSYFTALFNTPAQQIERAARCVLNQTNPNWEWVVCDDSNNTADAQRLEKFFASLGNNRIKYFRFNLQSGGFIGESKRRAASLCTGEYLAELDHDDLLMPDITEKILANGPGYDFIYSNSANVIVNPDESLTQGDTYPDGFAMGYGAYRTTTAANPLTGCAAEYQECIACPLNPKTIRHIVGVPNHIRVWNRVFYNSICGHNSDMWVVDDYELVVRTFLAGGKFLHLDSLGYLQTAHDKNTTDARRQKIQVLVAAVLAARDEAIRDEFESRGMEDWAYKEYAEKFGFNSYHYWDVATRPDAPAANDKV